MSETARPARASRDNSEAMMSACIHGMQAGAVTVRRDDTGLFIYLDPRSRVSIRIDLRPGYDDWEASRLGLEELSRAAAQAAREIAGLQSAAQVTEGNDG
jgi:multimeric flavodoxin WrbA